MQEKHKKAFSFPLLLFPSVIFHRANMYKTPLRRVDLQFHPPPPFFPQVIFFLLPICITHLCEEQTVNSIPPPHFSLKSYFLLPICITHLCEEQTVNSPPPPHFSLKSYFLLPICITHLCEEQTLRFELERHTVSDVVDELLQPDESGSSTCCCCLLIPVLHELNKCFLSLIFLIFFQVRRRKICINKEEKSFFFKEKSKLKDCNFQL